jgi:hypothetical protein
MGTFSSRVIQRKYPVTAFLVVPTDRETLKYILMKCRGRYEELDSDASDWLSSLNDIRRNLFWPCLTLIRKTKFAS